MPRESKNISFRTNSPVVQQCIYVVQAIGRKDARTREISYTVDGYTLNETQQRDRGLVASQQEQSSGS
jgi:hypothetical protein